MKTQKEWLTVPNLLSVLRILLIPLFVWRFSVGDYVSTAVLLTLSGLTDILDGWIARHFLEISDLGKSLDPVADKLTQVVMLICLVSKHQIMLVPLLLLVGKELFDGVTSLLVIRRTGQVLGAEWHGKLTTVLVFLMMLLHLLWQDIPTWVSNTLIIACLVVMVYSMVRYGIRNLRLLRGAKQKEEVTL